MTRQLLDWLQAIDLELYGPAFIEAGIDFSVLPDLTDEDLESLGVSRAHRRKLLQAIADLADQADAIPLDEGERRQLTVLVCEFTGLNELSSRLDPEESTSVIRRHREACAAAVERYDGVAARTPTDGVVAYFGYPQAHEDDAERATRAGLDIIAAIQRQEEGADTRLQASIGIATGRVVVGDAIQSALEPLAVGDAPNIAARVQALAPMGTVVIAASTRNLLAKVFNLRSLGDHDIEGLPGRLELWLVNDVAVSDSRFESIRFRRSNDFVGREPEAALLEACRRRAWNGEGQVMLISGEAGIGKSRFALHCIDQIAEQPHTYQRYQCSPFHTSSPFHPAIEQLRRAAGLVPDDPLDAQANKLESLLAERGADLPRTAPLLAALLSIPTGERYPPVNLSAAQQRQQTLTTLIDQWEGLSRQQLLVLLWEDTHWADASTLELLDLLIERIGQLPILLLITYRPEFKPGWIGLPNVSAVVLGRLPSAQVRAMVDQIAAGISLPSELLAQIEARTDGIPLFVEEMTKTVLDSGAASAIPITLQDSLMARLDHLSHARNVAQIAAVIGRDFTYDLLHAVAGQDRLALDHALAQIDKAELLLPNRQNGRYSFKHALVRDAAYESLLRSRRLALHHRIADALRMKFPATAEAEPGLVAHHLTEAGQTEAAIEWWSKAGEQSLARSAIVEASSHYRQAIELADTLPDESAIHLLRLKLQIAYSSTLITVHGHGAPETGAAFARAWELASKIEDPAERFPVYYGLWLGSHSRAELPMATQWSKAFLRDAERWPDLPQTGIAYRMVGTTAWVAGDLVTARARLEQALAIYNAERDRELRFRYGLDPGVVTMLQLAMPLWLLGEADHACRLAADGVALALRLNHVPTTVYAYGYACVFHAMRRDDTAVLTNAEAQLALIHAQDLRSNWQPIAVFFRDWVQWRRGDRTAGLGNMRQAVEICQKFGFLLFLPFYRSLLAEVEADGGDTQSALAMMDAAFADTELSQHRWLQAELHRGRAALLLRADATNPSAEADLLKGLGVARGQAAKSLELRAALDLGTLHRAQAQDLLAPIVAELASEASLHELAQARQLLALPR